MTMSDTHECVFPEEQEPSGRLILAPCLICGFSAMDAMAKLKSDLTLALTTQDQFAADIVAGLALLGIRDPDGDDRIADAISRALRAAPALQGEPE